jgi:hypothetical protein
MLAKLTGYQDTSTPELAIVVRSMQELCHQAHCPVLYKEQAALLVQNKAGGAPHGAAATAQLGLGPGPAAAALLGTSLLQVADGRASLD